MAAGAELALGRAAPGGGDLSRQRHLADEARVAGAEPDGAAGHCPVCGVSLLSRRLGFLALPLIIAVINGLVRPGAGLKTMVGSLLRDSK